MSQPALATVADLEARGVDVSNSARAQAALDDASAFIRDVASPEDWVNDDGTLGDVPDVVVAVCCRAAQRSLDNPRALQSESIGSYSSTFANSSPDVYLTKSERKAIRRAAGLTTGALGAVTIESPYVRHLDADYVDVEGGGDPILMGPWPNNTE